ncbi:hypothetical protein HYH03_008448 [Edaphochlamys debaryana]|uniref:Uncharacterized protein n=1 Tax=Edaphochlamys debaryana TaxID=47281 RepID=A0A835Y272_9CHLO|nr:hypothetical protein HYH03_008448 [Edaphochlamys debaryana]|eukprot:KAG2493313.1 hypothetical protein HYH03_008448 [Edaphochlamys debaryana]
MAYAEAYYGGASPTPETGTPESQFSPGPTPPPFVTTEELLRNIGARSAPASPSHSCTAFGSTAEVPPPVDRYQQLHAASDAHPLGRLVLPPEHALRAAALGGPAPVGPPPRFPNQLSPTLESILLGWRSLYECCRKPADLQMLVGQAYAPDAVFEDALVSARGQEALYRQFAMLGTAARAVQVGAYSLSVASVPEPLVTQAPPSPSEGGAAGPASASATARAARPTLPLHLTRVTVENVQCFTLAVPSLLTWLVGGKGAGVQVPLYVTSVLLVASDAPLAASADGSGLAPGQDPLTESRLASAAAVLSGSGGTGTGPSTSTGGTGGTGTGRAGGGLRLLVPDPSSSRAAGGAGAPARAGARAGPGPAGAGGSVVGPSGVGPSGELPGPTRWRIVHHVDRWHNVPLVWWALRRAIARTLDAVLSPLLRI